MSDPISFTGQAALGQAGGMLNPIDSVVQPGSGDDLNRLRSMMADMSSKNEVAASQAVNAADNVAVRSPGDAVLEGVAKIKNGYEDHLGSIETRLERISSGNALDLGNSFSETVGLQLEVAQWSMSVMGIDNSAKAGTNTVKELSKGG
jgi:hypothetical protein